MHVQGFKEPITVVKEWLAQAAICKTEYVDQTCPFTHVRLSARVDEVVLEGIGYTLCRFRHPDAWDAEWGLRVAKQRARKDIARQLVDGGFLPPDFEMHEDGVHVKFAGFVLLETSEGVEGCNLTCDIPPQPSPISPEDVATLTGPVS